MECLERSLAGNIVQRGFSVRAVPTLQNGQEQLTSHFDKREGTKEDATFTVERSVCQMRELPFERVYYHGVSCPISSTECQDILINIPGIFKFKVCYGRSAVPKHWYHRYLREPMSTDTSEDMLV